MKIALIGYGKMGIPIEEIALTRGHDIVLKVSIRRRRSDTISNIRKADAVIEFTGPHSAYDNIIRSSMQAYPLSPAQPAGWTNSNKSGDTVTKNKAVSFMPANHDVGVNIFFEVNRHWRP